MSWGDVQNRTIIPKIPTEFLYFSPTHVVDHVKNVPPPLSLHRIYLQELLSKDKWVHARPYLLRSGRTRHPAELPAPKEGEVGDTNGIVFALSRSQEAAMEVLNNRLEQLANEDPPLERFTSIVADSKMQVVLELAHSYADLCR